MKCFLLEAKFTDCSILVRYLSSGRSVRFLQWKIGNDIQMWILFPIALQWRAPRHAWPTALHDRPSLAAIAWYCIVLYRMVCYCSYCMVLQVLHCIVLYCMVWCCMVWYSNQPSLTAKALPRFAVTPDLEPSHLFHHPPFHPPELELTSLLHHSPFTSTPKTLPLSLSTEPR